MLFRRHPSITIPVLEIVAGLGTIEHGRRIAQTVSTGVCRIELLAENDFLITLPAVIPDDDTMSVLFQNTTALIQSEICRAAPHGTRQKLTEGVDKLLTELVYPFREHFIDTRRPTLDSNFLWYRNT